MARRKKEQKSTSSTQVRKNVNRILWNFFISYAHGKPEEEKLAVWLHDALSEQRYNVFLDQKEIAIGTNWGEAISSAIMDSDFFIVLLSDNSVRSEMVTEEVCLAHENYRNHGRPRVLPVRVKYEGSLLYPLGAYLRQHQCWKWQSASDSEPLLREILRIAQGSVVSPDERPSASCKRSVLNVSLDPRVPEPMVDLSTINAPSGCMRPDDPFYITRDADTVILSAAQRVGETIIIKGARQMGKSSLLKRYLLAGQRGGKKTVFLDLSLYDSADLADYRTFLTRIMLDLLDKLDLSLEPPSEIDGNSDMNHFMEEFMFKAIPDPVVLAFDESDRVFGRYYQTDFFSMLRCWHNTRANTPATGWARTDLGLVISTEPYLLIDDAYRSPFNVGETVELRPFDQAEC